MYNRILALILSILVALILVLPYTASASPRLGLDGNISLWWDIYEENENGIIQAGTEDPAAKVASGFNIRQARVTFNYDDTDYPINAKMLIRLEERIALLDCYGTWQPLRFFHIYAGQMKVPSTYEALTSDSSLDFISRSAISKNLADWSLSRPPYYSPFYGNRSDYRDTGIGIKGTIGPISNPDLASYFLMVSNGLGADLFIGGKESKEYILSNNIGDYFYGARLDISPFKWLNLGGHYSWNKHDNMLFNDEKTVLDLDRYSWSTDLHFILPYVQLVALYAAGAVNDDYFHADLSNLEYSGWEAKILAQLICDRLQLGVRYDNYTESFFGGGAPTKQGNLTFGVNFIPASNTRLQLNYVIKKTDSKIKPDLDDNILFLNFQYSFHINCPK